MQGAVHIVGTGLRPAPTPCPVRSSQHLPTDLPVTTHGRPPITLQIEDRTFARLHASTPPQGPPPRQRELRRAYQAEFFVCVQTIARLWARLKEWRAVATRYKKTVCSFMGILCIAASSDRLRR